MEQIQELNDVLKKLTSISEEIEVCLKSSFLKNIDIDEQEVKTLNPKRHGYITDENPTGVNHCRTHCR